MFIKFINKIATEWNEKNDLLKRTENQIDNLDIVIKQSDVFVENITSLIPDEKFDFEKKMIDAGDLVALFSAVYEKIRDRLSEKSRRQEDIRKNTQIIEVFINNNPDFTTERLKFLSDIDVQIYIQKNKDIDNELIKVKQTFIIKTEEKESHQNSESRIYRETGSRVNQWSTPLDFLANIAQSGGEAEAMAFGFSVSDFDASVIVAKGTVDLPIGTLIWHNGKPKYRDTEETMLDEKTADYRVLRALDSINFTRYLLKAVVK